MIDNDINLEDANILTSEYLKEALNQPEIIKPKTQKLTINSISAEQKLKMRNLNKIQKASRKANRRTK